MNILTKDFSEIARGRDIESVLMSDFSLAVLAAKSISLDLLLILEIIRVIYSIRNNAIIQRYSNFQLLFCSSLTAAAARDTDAAGQKSSLR